MIRISGKDVFTELDELVEPAHTALLLVDMQRDFVEPDGAFGSLGVDLSMYVRMRPVLQKLTCAARSAGVLIIHIQNTTLPERTSDSPAQIRFNLRMHEQARNSPHSRASSSYPSIDQARSGVPTWNSFCGATVSRRL